MNHFKSFGRRFRLRFARGHFETLEPRTLLDANVDDYRNVSPAWFARLTAEPAANANFVGPLPASVGMGAKPLLGPLAAWIVRLNESATQRAKSVSGVQTLLRSDTVQLLVVRGLGLPGQVLVQSDSPADEVRAALSANPNVAEFEPDEALVSQRMPDDPEFSSLIGLHNDGQFDSTRDADIDAPEAWDETIGSTNVVVGVIDSGIDVTHPDLYLNIWINQGEIPTTLRSQLADTDSDGRITFYDLNAPGNARFARDTNGNSFLDAQDLLNDPRWADGVDTDRNGFVDDFFGWNFRSAANEPFVPNDPRDALGHGTHVAGIIGAIGNNGRGVTGINWRSSLMSLKFLDNGNSGQTSDAIAAVNYATMMRRDRNENVRVLNASFGQSGGESPGFRTAINSAGQAGILFVAAAGNGNILGQGINLDREPFYPASYELLNVLSVAASGPHDELARFSNFGRTSVDLAAPGVGIRSTLLRGGYGSQNGTSMAAPHVTGAAALVWSAFPDASVTEVREALLEQGDAVVGLVGTTASGKRLNAGRAFDSEIILPRASLLNPPQITVAGGTEVRLEVRYLDNQGLNEGSIDSGDVIVTRQWGPRDILATTLDTFAAASGGKEIVATYRLAAPGGSWDPLDFGRYVVSVVGGQVTNRRGQAVPTDAFGEFFVRVVQPDVMYVSSYEDATDSVVGDGKCASVQVTCTLRAAIQEAAAAAPEKRTVFLEAGNYGLSLLPQGLVNPLPDLTAGSGCLDSGPATVSDSASGDLNVAGNVEIVGDLNATTTIDGRGVDRVFSLLANSRMTLRRLKVTGGKASARQGGGAIFSAGDLQLDTVVVAGNSTSDDFALGGGLAIWGGTTRIVDTTISENRAYGGGGVFICNRATVDIVQSTVSYNVATNDAQYVDYQSYHPGGAALLSMLGGNVKVTNSTFSTNTVDFSPHPTDPEDVPSTRDNRGGAIHVVDFSDNDSTEPVLSANGRFVAFTSTSRLLASQDLNVDTDIFVYDRETHSIERVSVLSQDTAGNGSSISPSISADGRYVAFASNAFNFVAGDVEFSSNIFVFDRQTHQIERVSVSNTGEQGNRESFQPSISSDARFVAFASNSSNLVPGDSNNGMDIFVFDRLNKTVDRVSLGSDGIQGNSTEYSLVQPCPSISANGRFVAFTSESSNFNSGDNNGVSDVFVFDRHNRTLELVSRAVTGIPANGRSEKSSISDDGRFVSFVSAASDLVPGDTNNAPDTFVWDRGTQTMQRVTAAPFGRNLSADGRFEVFASAASNLAPGDVNGAADIFIRDNQTGQIEAITSPLVGDTTSQPATLEHATIADNVASEAISGRVEFHNSLFAGNTWRGAPFPAFDIGRATRSRGFNLYTSWEYSVLPAATDVQVNARSFLGALRDNGGLTSTHTLLEGSPARNAADSVNAPATDQRGFLRSQSGDGARPDIGAAESFLASISGTVFADLDGDGWRDPTEPSLSGREIRLATDGEHTAVISATDGSYDFTGLLPGPYTLAAVGEVGRKFTTTTFERVGSVSSGFSRWNAQLSDDRRFVAFSSSAGDLVPSDTNGAEDVFVNDRQNRSIERVNIGLNGAEANGPSSFASLSGNGQLVVFRSAASNLVAGDTNDIQDLFVYDRRTRAVERIAVGVVDYVSVSSEGQFVALSSTSENLVAGDTNLESDVFLLDRRTGIIERVSVASDGVQANRGSYNPTISADGRYVTFESYASNLVAGDHLYDDVFVYDRITHAIELITPAFSGLPTEFFAAPFISASGRFVGFHGDAADLVSGDTNDDYDVFVYDRQTRVFERVNVAEDGTQGNRFSGYPSISADGRFVAFESFAPTLVSNDHNRVSDVFVFDRQARKLARVSVTRDGVEGNSGSSGAVISSDGKEILFSSSATNFVDGDANDRTDIFIRRNPLLPPPEQRSVYLALGQSLANIDIGLQPLPGEIRGNCFVDVVPNGVRDSGEILPQGVQCLVYLDANANGQFDSDETTQRAAADGSFRFAALAGDKTYFVAVQVPDGFALVSEGLLGQNSIRVYLPVGVTISDRDFGLRPFRSTGQSESATVSGRLFLDANGNHHSDPEETGVGGVTLFLDQNNNGTREFDERQTVSAEGTGEYEFAGLGNQLVTVRVLETEGYTQAAPVGNNFARQSVSLAVSGNQLGNPLDIAAGDFNADGWPDLAAAMFDRNAVALLLNDHRGGFLPLKEVSLAPSGLGASRLLVGDFNGQGGDDLAVVNYLSSKISVLLDFNGTTFNIRDVVVPDEPNGIASGMLDADGDLDLIVTHNRPTGERNLSILRNDGQGQFTLDAASPLTGNYPAAVVVGDFNHDSRFDFAVADFGTSSFDGDDFGDVRVFLAQANGGFQSHVACTVGFGPLALTASDLDRDGELDLSVANFLSNNVTVCEGNGDGTFTARMTLAGGLGPLTVVADDVDEDGDSDILTTSGKSKDVGILRNESTAGTFQFQAAESFGVTDYVGEARISLTTADLDKNGVVDLAVASNDENRVLVSRNTLVAGAYRLALTGVENVPGVNFGFQVTVPPPAPDDDQDGIPNAEESLAPNGGDGNFDGVMDANQSYVASLRRESTGKYVTLESPADVKLENVRFATPPANPPTDINFSLGLLDFRMHVPSGGATTVTIFPEQTTGLNAYFKFGPTAEIPTPHWYRFLFDGRTGAVILPDRIVVYLRDGERGDDDLTANGTIVDPGAPAVNEHPHLWQNADAVMNVNGDDNISPQDALLVINELVSHGGHDLPGLSFPITQILYPLLDVNGDDRVTANDALLIIEDLNTRGGRPVEAGEPLHSAAGEPPTGAVVLGISTPAVPAANSPTAWRSSSIAWRNVSPPYPTRLRGSLTAWEATSPPQGRSHRFENPRLDALQDEWDEIAEDISLVWTTE